MNIKYNWKILGGAVFDIKNICGETRRSTFKISTDVWMNIPKILRENPDISEANLDNFRRSDPKSRSYIVAAILAFFDADIKKNSYTTVPVIDCSRCGCHYENLIYYHDYIENGRNLGRGHLFVGTLPSTPLCDAAISLKLNGSAYYIDTLGGHDILWSEIESLLEDEINEQVLFFHCDESKVYCLCFGRGITEIPSELSPSELYSM